MDGTGDFDRKWKSYKERFGHVEGKYWLGNDRPKRHIIEFVKGMIHRVFHGKSYMDRDF